MAEAESDVNSAALEYGGQCIGVDSLKDEQKSALVEFLRMKDVFVSLPTWYGKSAVFEAVPFCLDYLDSMCGHWQSEESHIMLLIALIEDRKATLQRRGIASIYLGGEDHDTDMETFRDVARPETRETMLSHKGRI